MKRRASKLVTLVLSLALSALCLLPLTACDGYCQHKLKELEKVPATCMATGLRTAYKCEKCGLLFHYSDATGLVETNKREVLPKSGHTVGEVYVGKNKDGGDEITSLADYEVYAECAVCEELFKVNPENLIAFAPSDYSGGTHFDIEEEGRAAITATKYTFAAGTTSGTCRTIEPLRDSGKSATANVEVPFEANVNRYLIMFAHNESNIDVDIKYGAERNGQRCNTEVHVPANGFASFLVTINFSGGDPRSWHELYMMQDISAPVTLSLCGYYFATNKLRSIAIQEYGRNEYGVGETLDVDKIVVVADYGENVKRELKPEEYTIDLAGKVLTEEDEEVVITYKNKTVKFPITVRHFYRKVTLIGATFADGSSTKELDQGKPLPSTIVINGGRTLDHWVDMYGESYTEYTVGEGDITLTAVFEGMNMHEQNLALRAPVTASEVGFNPSNFGIGSITDGNKSTYNAWGSDPHSAQDDVVWVQVDLGAVKAINEIELHPRGDGAYFPIDYYIEVSTDGVNYTKVFEMAGDPLSSRNLNTTRHCFIDDVSARYVRVTSTKMTNGGGGLYYVDYGEIEIYRNV